MKTLLLFLAVAFAQKSQILHDASAEAIFQKLAVFQKSFPSGRASCEIPARGDCNLETYCQAVLPERNSAYLYQNSEGRKISNFQLVYASDEYSRCMDPASFKTLSDGKKDPFLFPEVLQDKKNLEAKAQYNEAFQRAAITLKEVKVAMVELLESKRNSQNENEIRNSISRIQSVELHGLKDFSTRAIASAGCGIPNAFYDPTENGHTITICPQLLNMPEPALYATLSHELAHAMDPCNLSYALVKTTKDGKARFQQMAPNSKTASNELAVAEGVLPTSNPFEKELQCLQSPQSTGLKLPTFDEQRVALEEQIAKREAIVHPDKHATDSQLQMLKSQSLQLDDHQHFIGYCAFDIPGAESLSRHDALRESFSDAVAAAMIARKVRSLKPQAAKKWSFESLAIPLQQDCAGFSNDQKESLLQKMKSKKCDVKKIAGVLGMEAEKTHLSASVRTEKIALAPEQIQQALGCEPKNSVKACF